MFHLEEFDINPDVDFQLQELLVQMNSPILEECLKMDIITYLYDQDKMPNNMRKAKLFRHQFNLVSDLLINPTRRMLHVAIFNPSFGNNLHKAKLMSINVIIEGNLVIRVYNSISNEM